MRKYINPYYLVLLLMFALLVFVEYSAPKPVDWRRTYAKDDKIPFGCNAMYRLLDEDVFQGRMKLQKETPFNVLLKPHEKKAAYVFVNSNLSFSRLDAQYLLQFVEAGNDVFMAASSFYQNKIADTFHISTDRIIADLTNVFDSTQRYPVNYCSPWLRNNKSYTYKTGFSESHFSAFDTAKVTVLARGNDTNAIFLRASLGKGNFYFLSTPDIFTNYFVVNDSARFFAYKALSYLDAGEIWWDEYFKGFNVRSGEPLQFIFSNDSLYTGYILLFVSLIVFMLFAMKRKQRAIAIVSPLTNSTLEFVEVVGSVYYNTRNHKIIAEEKISSFYEFLRSKFMVTSRRSDAETIERIVKLSGVSEEEVRHLFLQIGMVWRQGSITEQELINLNKSIENFYKLNKR